MKAKQNGIFKNLRQNGAISALLILLSFAIVFSLISLSVAYFSATTTRRGTMATGVLTLDIVSSDGSTITSSDFSTMYPNDLVPGDTLNANQMYVENTSNFPVYSILKLKLEFFGQGATEPGLTFEKWSNYTNTEIVIGTTQADVLTAGQRKQANVSYTIPFRDVGNEYQGGKCRLTLKAYAVQQAHIPPLENTQNTQAEYAAKFLCEDYVSRNISVTVGNSSANTVVLDGNTVADLSVTGVTTDNSCGWYYDAACTIPAYPTDVITQNTALYTKEATTSNYQVSSSTASAVTITGTSGATGEVVIPQTINGVQVKTIASSAFANNTNITSVTIPEGVTTISANAFDGCSNLETITIPSTCTSIGALAFKNNTSLRSITLNYELITFSYGDVWAGVENTPLYGATTAVFNEYGNAYYLGNENNEYMALVKAKNTSITNLTVHSNCKNIASYAFSSCAYLRTISLPEGLLKIGNRAFHGCLLLSSITLPNTLKSLGSLVFYYCKKLTSLYIPASVTSIGESPCVYCDLLDHLEVDPNNQYYDSRNNCNAIINTSTNTLIQGSNSTIIPSSVQTLANYCLMGIKGFKTSVIPSSVTKIGYYALQDTACEQIIIPSSVSTTQSGIFKGCTKLTAIYCERSSQSGWSNNMFDNCSATVYWYRETQPAGSGNYWHYVNGEPVIWS